MPRRWRRGADRPRQPQPSPSSIHSTFPCCSAAQSRLTLRPHGLQHVRLPCPSLSPWSLLKLMSIELVMTSNHPVLCLIHFLFQLEFCVVDAWGDSHGLCDWSSGLLGPQVSVRGPCGAWAAPSLLSGAVQQPGQVRDILALFLATWCGMQDLSSLTRDRTHAPCNGSMESRLWDCQGSPQHLGS